MDDKFEISLLYDFYGSLLAPAQQRTVELYVNDDLSLSEAAELLAISRQGVRDALSRACAKLRSYEERLSLLEQYRERGHTGERIAALARRIAAMSDNDEITALTDDIVRLASTLTEQEE